MPRLKNKRKLVGRRLKGATRRPLASLSDAAVGRPRIYTEQKLKYYSYRDIAERLWLPDYRPIVEAAIAEHPAMAETITGYLSAAPGHYKRLLASNSDPTQLAAYSAKVDLRLAELIGEIDGMASQKCKSVLKEAKGIAFKLTGISMCQVKAASYSGKA
jgi:hypothetical protein